MIRYFSLTLLAATAAFAQIVTPQSDPVPTETAWMLARCQAQGTGGVHCTDEAFEALTDMTLEAQAEAEKNALLLAGCTSSKQALEAALLARPVTPVTPKLRPQPFIAVAVAIIGTVAATTAAASPSMEPGTRIGLGIGGVLVAASSFTLLF